MTASISATYAYTVAVTETFAGADASNPDILINGLGDSDTINAGTTVPATKVAKFNQALTAGAATIDLTALPGQTADETVVGTGLKVQIAEFRNLSTNANNITVTFGAANGYLLAGAAWKAILAPGQSVRFILKDAAPDVDGTHKNIDLAGTGTQVLEVFLILG